MLNFVKLLYEFNADEKKKNNSERTDEFGKVQEKKKY